MSRSSFIPLEKSPDDTVGAEAPPAVAGGRSLTGFTLIELLVVIAILAILSVAAVLVINPLDLIRQSRDSSRLADLNALNKALALFDVTNPNDFTGTSTHIYTSLPAQTAGECPGMPSSTLPSGYMYYCVASSTLSKTDGTGWIPANLASISYGSPIGKLPIDPENSSTTGRFYTYIMGGSWELNALYESSRYKGDNAKSKANQPGILSIGTNQSLNPVYSANGLIAFYDFAEQTGTTLNDKSGNSYTGTITAGTGDWTTDQKDNARAYSFDGANTTIPTTLTATSSFQNGFTISAWVKADSAGEGSAGRIVDKSSGDNSDSGFRFLTSSSLNRLYLQINTGTGIYSGENAYSINAWSHVLVIVSSNATVTYYINGVQSGTPGTTGALSGITTANALTIGNRSGATDRTFNGNISDVRIYNRVLGTAEIKAIYNATR